MRCRLPSVLIALSALLAASCTRRETPAEAGLRTHTLLLGNQNEPATLDPQLYDAATDYNVIGALFEGLTNYDEKTATAVPGVAERWEISPDGLVYTFHLRANARWSNGDRVTARDFAWSFQRFISPALGNFYAYYFYPVRGAEAFATGQTKDFSGVGVEALDDLTLRVTLARPAAYFLGILATTALPVHRASVEAAGRFDDRTSPWARPGKLIGNGAFTLTEWQPNARIVVTKNPFYWGAAQNRIERVIFYPIEKAEAEELDFRAGQLHVTFSVPPSKLATYRQAAPEKLRIDPLLQLYLINFNATKPPFTNPKVRRALALALDRAAIASSVFSNARLPAPTLVPPNCGGYTGPAGQTENFAAARALLAEAGYPGGRGLPAMPLQVLNDDKLPKIAEVIQALWHRELGVEITIEPYDQKTWLQNQISLNHVLAVRGWTADFPDPIAFLDMFRTGNGSNAFGWSNRTYDALLDQAAATADRDARFALLRKAEALMLDDAACAPLIFGARTYLIDPAVKNWVPAPLGIHRYQLIDLQAP
jgi:oligopeptide transport system substrate-binding protein